MGEFKLIAADLDGTLLDDTYTVRPELAEVVNLCRQKGTELVVATGRLFPSALPFVNDLGVKLPVIASNGAVVRDPVTGGLINTVTMARSLALEALELTENGTCQRFVNIRDAFYTDAPLERTRKYAEALNVDFIRSVPLADVVTEDPTMVVIRDEDNEIARLTAILRKHFGDRVYLANSKPFFIDINNRDVSKGAALVDLCKRLGVKPREVIAIGDGWNDLEMFEAAGVGAAVANAPRELKEKADYVARESTYLGVIEVLRKYVL